MIFSSDERTQIVKPLKSWKGLDSYHELKDVVTFVHSYTDKGQEVLILHSRMRLGSTRGYTHMN